MKNSLLLKIILPLLSFVGGCTYLNPDQIRVPETKPTYYVIEGKNVKSYQNMFGPYRITEVRDPNENIKETYINFIGSDNWFAWEVCSKGKCNRSEASKVSSTVYESIAKRSGHYLQKIQEIEKLKDPNAFIYQPYFEEGNISPSNNIP